MQINDNTGQGQLNNAQALMANTMQWPGQAQDQGQVRQSIDPTMQQQGQMSMQMQGQAPQMQQQGNMVAPPMIGQGQPPTNKTPSPLDMLIQYATKDEREEKEVSLKTLKKSEVDKIMKAYSKCKDEADNYYKSTIQPKIIDRENAYYARKEYFKKLFPVLSETSEFCSRDIQTAVKWMMPSVCEPFLGCDDPVDIKGVNANDDKAAGKIQQLLKYQLQRKNSYPSFIDAIWGKALALNYGVAKAYWKRDETRERYQIMVDSINDFQTMAILNEEANKGKAEIISIEPVEDAPDLTIVTFEKIILKANYPVVQYMSPSELRYTPDSNDLQGSKFKAHRKIVTGDYLKRKEQDGIYEQIDKAMQDYSGDTSYDTYDTNRNKELSTINKRLSDDDVASKVFELYEGYLDVDYNNDGIYEHLIVHAIGNTPIRISINEMEYAPFFIASAEPSPDTVFNEDEGFADNLEQQQSLKTALFRQIITNVAKNNAPKTYVDLKKVDINSLIDNDEIIGVEGDPRASIMSGEQLNLSPLSMEVINYAQNEIEAQSGSTRYNQGLDSNSLNKTATGITAIMGSAEKRMKHMARMFSETFIIPLFKFLILLNQKYLDQEQMFRLADENIVIDKEELDIDYDLIINVGQGAGTREAQIQYIMIMLSQIFPVLQQSGIVNEDSWYMAAKKLLEQMGIRNVDSYLTDPSGEKAQQLKQQAQQLAQQQAQQKQQEEMALLKAKAEFELEKAKTPKVSVNYEDLPIDAQIQFLKWQGINVTTADMIDKERLNNAK